MTRLMGCTALLLALFCLLVLVGLVALGADGLATMHALGGAIATPLP